MAAKHLTILLSAGFALSLAACEDGSSGTTNQPGGSGAADTGGSDGGDATADAGGAYKQLDITLPNIDGDDLTLTSKTDKDLHILCFWAVWCTPCQAELAQMAPMWEEMKGRGLNVYAVSIDGPDTASRVPGFANSQGYPFPVLMDRETEFLTEYNPKGDIPFYVILDADGNVVKTHQGYVEGDMDGLREYLEEKLPAE
jgi:peroxiredoxin